MSFHLFFFFLKSASGKCHSNLILQRSVGNNVVPAGLRTSSVKMPNKRTVFLESVGSQTADIEMGLVAFLNDLSWTELLEWFSVRFFCFWTSKYLQQQRYFSPILFSTERHYVAPTFWWHLVWKENVRSFTWRRSSTWQTMEYLLLSHLHLFNVSLGRQDIVNFLHNCFTLNFTVHPQFEWLKWMNWANEWLNKEALLGVNQID